VLLGQNGSGKSTIIKVLSGYHLPDPGAEVYVGGDRLQFGSSANAYQLGLRFVHQDLGLVASSSVSTTSSSPLNTRLPPARFAARCPQSSPRALESVGLELNPDVLVSPSVPRSVPASRWHER